MKGSYEIKKLYGGAGREYGGGGRICPIERYFYFPIEVQEGNMQVKVELPKMVSLQLGLESFGSPI